MLILGIETSCDETSAAVVEKTDDTLIVKSNVVASSFLTHQPTGGIIPENAAREQIKYILPVIKESLDTAQITLADIDAFALTYGPGLIGSLLVGVETIKTFAYVLNKPIIPVNHMLGHIYANFINFSPLTSHFSSPKFPALALVVSGGHTDLLLMEDHGKYQLLGGTRDDAAGEAFDKIGRLLGFPYPAGPIIEQRAKLGNPKRFIFPRPLVGSDDYDFSFSGLKTAVLREVQKLTKTSSPRHSGLSRISDRSHLSDSGVANTPQNDEPIDEQTTNDICAGVQKAIISVLIKKTLKAAKEYNVKSILLSGGVAANETLKETFEQITKDQQPTTKFFAPAKNLCTDNGAMIAAAAAFNYNPIPWQEITANPELYF